MTSPKLNDDEFIAQFEANGAKALAIIAGVAERDIYRRRRTLEAKYSRIISAPNQRVESKPRINLDLDDGTIVVFSDCHYWPGEAPLMHKILLKVIKKLKPKLVIANGDVCDFASISRFAPLGWEDAPTVIEELEVCQKRMEEVRQASGDAMLIWTAGNHDMRFEAAFAKHLPEMAKVKGVHLKDHFPHWPTAWSVWINDEIVIKHRLYGGMNALRNNVMKSRKHCVTGHLHSANVYANTGYENDTLYGIDCGTIADTYGPQFMYCEDNPRDWRSAFGVLTLDKGRLLRPELCQVRQGICRKREV